MILTRSQTGSLTIEYRTQCVQPQGDGREQGNLVPGTGVDMRAEKGGIIMPNAKYHTVNFSVKGDSWVNSVTFTGAIIDLTGATDEKKAYWMDKSIIIEHQKPLRSLTEDEARKLAKVGYTFSALTAGHKIVSPAELQRQALAHAATMSKEGRAQYIKDLQAMDKE